jgi:hypothetical protein
MIQIYKMIESFIFWFWSYWPSTNLKAYSHFYAHCQTTMHDPMYNKIILCAGYKMLNSREKIFIKQHEQDPYNQFGVLEDEVERYATGSFMRIEVGCQYKTRNDVVVTIISRSNHYGDYFEATYNDKMLIYGIDGHCRRDPWHTMDWKHNHNYNHTHWDIVKRVEQIEDVEHSKTLQYKILRELDFTR